MHRDHACDDRKRHAETEDPENVHPSPRLRDRQRVAIVAGIRQLARVEDACNGNRSRRDQKKRCEGPPTARRQAARRKEQQRPGNKHDQTDENPVVDPRGPLQQRSAARTRHLAPRGREQPEGSPGPANEKRQPESVPRRLREDQRSERRARRGRKSEPSSAAACSARARLRHRWPTRRPTRSTTSPRAATAP
jgi:hypothetical protein